MDPDRARRMLAYLRLALGGAWLIPRVGARLFGLDPDDNDGIVLMTRLFAIRDVAIGMTVLQTTSQDQADRLVDLGIMVDAADLTALVAAVARKDIGARAFVLGGGAAAGAVALGILSRRS